MADENAVTGVESSLGVSITPEDLSKAGMTSANMSMANDLSEGRDSFGALIVPELKPNSDVVSTEPGVDADIQKFVAEALGQTPTTKVEGESREGEKPAGTAQPVIADETKKSFYTAEEMAGLDADNIDTARIPNEFLPFYKSMLRPVTRKSQEYSERIRELDRRQAEIDAKIDLQRRQEYQQRLAAEESQLTPEELQERRRQQEIEGLRYEVQAIRQQDEQRRLTMAIEDDYSANAKVLGIPDEIKDDALTLVWKQWQLDKANGNVDSQGRPRSTMREILEANKSKLDRLAGGSMPSKLDLNTLKSLIKANPEIGKAYVMEIINQYVQSKKQGATVITTNPTAPLQPQQEGEKKINSWDDWQNNRDNYLQKYAR